jgi:phenylalanyl-tRNA synthetase alpha chain
MDKEKILSELTERISKINNLEELEGLKILYLGRKGIVTQKLRALSGMGEEERKLEGKELNLLKKSAEEIFTCKENDILGSLERSLSNEEWLDVTSPGLIRKMGSLHPVTTVAREMIDIFKSLGFEVASGPEIETDWFNFEALNIPKDHPARDTQATFFITDELLLRTQTSPVQVRVMQIEKPPIRIIAPGKTYRRDSDITHTPMFHQLEGLLVDEKVTLTDLKGTLEYFVKTFFGHDRKVRFRPHYFPFTEPSLEVDISCGICRGDGCRVCKHSGWMEIMGAGMVHPNVLTNSGIDPQKYQGFAFGIGIERPAMLRHNIDDLRLFYENDLRFLEQF